MGNTDKRNIPHKDNSSLIFTFLQRGQDQGTKTEITQGAKNRKTGERDEILVSRVRGHFVLTREQISYRLVQELLNVIT